MRSSDSSGGGGATSFTGAQVYPYDPRNDDVRVYVNGQFFHRSQAMVSVFDSGFAMGDGVWEGVRLIDGRLVALDEHLDRLFDGLSAINLDLALDRQAVAAAIRTTVDMNGMRDGVHIRLMVTRGPKRTPSQDPRFALGKPTMVIVAEHKALIPTATRAGLKLLTATFRCSTPDVFDLRLNSHSRLNLIQALIQALNAGCDEALMLDQRGFVASCNSTNFFIVRDKELWTSTGAYNFKGITRRKTIELYTEEMGEVREKDFTLAEVYSADEAFVTGTLGGITPVAFVDGRRIGDGQVGPVTRAIGQSYLQRIIKA